MYSFLVHLHNYIILIILNFFLKEVQPNSPADIAGLRSNTDYIIGADSVLHEVRTLLKGCFPLINSNCCGFIQTDSSYLLCPVTEFLLFFLS